MSDQPNVVDVGQQWSLYSAAQNLSAVLNDPNRGKQVILSISRFIRETIADVVALWFVDL
jgi:hypothetical protein